jgi:ferredoxin
LLFTYLQKPAGFLNLDPSPPLPGDAMGSPKWFVELIKKSYPGRFFFARLTNLPILGHMVGYSFFKGDDMIYLPRDNTIRIHEQIESTEEIVLPSQVVEYFIEQANYHWIMDFCLCRAGNDCQDYPVSYGCLFLGEAVLKINPEFGRLVSKQEALDHIRRCRDAGLVHMIGRSKLDAVWLGTSPANKLLTICNCCPCCCLWKVLPVVNPMISKRVYKMPGTQISVDPNLCAGCGVCTESVCFVDAIHLENDIAVIDETCRACGRCFEVCPNQAIELTILDDSYIRETIQIIAPLVDVT